MGRLPVLGFEEQLAAIGSVPTRPKEHKIRCIDRTREPNGSPGMASFHRTQKGIVSGTVHCIGHTRTAIPRDPAKDLQKQPPLIPMSYEDVSPLERRSTAWRHTTTGAQFGVTSSFRLNFIFELMRLQLTERL